jgi:hypothetical protein
MKKLDCLTMNSNCVKTKQIKNGIKGKSGIRLYNFIKLKTEINGY